MKYEEVCLKAYTDGRQAKTELETYFRFYNAQRPHQALDYHRPRCSTETRCNQLNTQGRGGGHQAEHWQTLGIRWDSHLILPQPCPTDGVHLTNQSKYFQPTNVSGV